MSNQTDFIQQKNYPKNYFKTSLKLPSSNFYKVISLVIGKNLAIGYWLLAIGFWLLAIGFWLWVIAFWLLAFGYWLWVIAFWFWLLAFSYCLLVFGYCLLPIGFGLLPFTFCLLAINYWLFSPTEHYYLAPKRVNSKLYLPDFKAYFDNL